MTRLRLLRPRIENDYFDSGTERLLYLLPLLQLCRLLTPRPEDLLLFGVEPEDPLFPHVCTQTLNPSPTYLCPIFYNLSSIFIIIMSSCCIAFVGSVNSNTA